MRKSILPLLVALALGAGACAVRAQRLVVVNGQRLDTDQIAWLEQRQCSHVPNGHYWLDLRTGAWGYAGWPRTQGFLGAPCGTSRSQPRSLSERGLLYRPGELINGR